MELSVDALRCVSREVSQPCGRGLFRFHSEVVKVSINPNRARLLFEQAVAVLKGPKPQQHSACAFCTWGDAC